MSTLGAPFRYAQPAQVQVFILYAIADAKA